MWVVPAHDSQIDLCFTGTSRKDLGGVFFWVDMVVVRETNKARLRREGANIRGSRGPRPVPRMSGLTFGEPCLLAFAFIPTTIHKHVYRSGMHLATIVVHCV